MSLKSKIQALLTFSNETTGESDTTLGAAVKRLAEGYGQGGGDDIVKALISSTSLASLTIPDGTTKIRDYAFYGCAIASFEIPIGVKSIGKMSFNSNNSLTQLVLPEGITSIGQEAFEYCKSLTTLDIPSTITSIGNWCFQGCTSKVAVTCRAIKPPTISSATFSTSTISAIYVPADYVDTYKAAANWSTFASLISAIEE